MNQLKIGQVLKGKESYEDIKILGLAGDEVQHRVFGDTEVYSEPVEEIKKHWLIPETPFEPNVGDSYWYINDYGEKENDNWDDAEVDRLRRDFLGIRPTEEAMEQRLKEIKEKIK